MIRYTKNILGVDVLFVKIKNEMCYFLSFNGKEYGNYLDMSHQYVSNDVELNFRESEENAKETIEDLTAKHK